MSESPAKSDAATKARSSLLRALFRYMEEMGPEQTRQVLIGWASAISIMGGVLVARESEE